MENLGDGVLGEPEDTSQRTEDTSQRTEDRRNGTETREREGLDSMDWAKVQAD